jgi:general secretion pathway protein D
MIRSRFLITICLIVLIVGYFTEISPAQNNGKTEISAAPIETIKPANDSFYQDPEIIFDFVDVEITTIIKFISEITGNNFVFDERIKGKITIIAPTKLSINESFRLFTSILTLKGYTIIPSGPKTYKIIPSSLAKQAGQISEDTKGPINEGYITKILPTEHIKAKETLQFLRPIVSKNGHISAFGPSNLLLVVDSAVNIEKIISILRLIDQPTVSEEGAKIYVYFLEHADATELSKVLQGIIRNLQTARKSVNRNGKKRPAKAPPVLSVTPDQATNSLVIVAPSSEYGNIEKVIKTLDKRRKQVYVEAMIMEASTDKLQELGTKWRASATHDGEPIVIGGVGNIDAATSLSIINGLSGFTMGGLGNFLDIPVTAVGSDGSVSTNTLTTPGFAALFSSNEFKDVINVLSTPQILTSDNEEAEIHVGENVPFISQRERNATTTNTVLNTIERTDVGIKLRIKPQITEGNYVKLEIFQEISAVKTATDDILTTVGPSTTKRSTKTTVVVKDGRTVVIGGLMQEMEEESINKVPILGDIPILGWLFKFKSKSMNKKNLLVFLSPHIVTEDDDLTTLTETKRQRLVKEEKFYKRGELFIKFNEGVSEERALEIIKKRNASVIKHFESSGVYHIKLKQNMEVEEAIDKFTSYPEVMYTEPNYKVSLKSSVLDNGNQGEVEKPSCPEGKVKDKGQQESTMKEQAEDKKKLPPTDIEVVDVKTLTQDKPETEVQHSDAEIPEDNSPHQVEQVADHENSSDSEKNNAAIKETVEVRHSEIVASDNEIEKINDRPTHAETVGESHKGNFYIQIGAWRKSKHAKETYAKLKSRYPEAYIITENDFSKVRIAGIMTKREGNLMIMELEDNYNLRPFLANNH